LNHYLRENVQLIRLLAGQYLGGEKYGKKTEVELRGLPAASGTLTPVNSSVNSPGPATSEVIASPTMTVKEITRRLSVAKVQQSPVATSSGEEEKK
jgi:hypothetical protein